MTRLFSIMFFALLAGCLNVAEDRAEADANVGRAEAEGWRVMASEGLAAVRALSADALYLWMSAPEVDVRIDNDLAVARSLTIRIENLLPEAVIEAHLGADEIEELLPVESPRSTARTLVVTVPRESTLTMTVRDPDPPRDERWSFLVFGDVQRAVGRVGDIYRRMNLEDARFVIMVGDLTSAGTRDELTRFDEELRALERPFYATLGNHELGAASTPYHEFYGRGSYRFDYGGLRFILLDSGSATIAPRVHDWLEGWLSEPPARIPIVIGTHIPLIDPVGARAGGFASRLEAHKLLAMFSSADVIATFYGHLHTFVAFSNGGIPAYITGGGGAIPDRWDGIGRHFLRVSFVPEARQVTSTLVRVD